MRFRAALLLTSIFLATASHAAVFVVAADDEMIETADAIVVGTVTAINGEFALNGDIVTNIDLQIDSVLKGNIDAAQPLRLRELGGVVGSRLMAVSESAAYWLDNRALIFLERDSDGAWRTLGTSLGKFDFVDDGAGQHLLVRWATSSDVSTFWTPDGHPHEEKLRDAVRFLFYIRKSATEPRAPTFPRVQPDYFVAPVEEGELSPPNAWDPTSDQTFPPSAYTQGTFRWEVFDDGGFVTFRVSGTQPGYDSIGAAQRALAAWTNDTGSNVDYRYGGTSTDRFVEDNKNTIVYNSSADVPSGALAYAKWYANATHTYKGETFYSIAEGDVVIRGSISVSQKVFEEAVTHEVGHTLGFRHSDQGTPSSTQAVMKAVLSGAFGSTLGPWDIDAVRTVYTSGGGGGVPAVPLGLVARATSTSSITISWNAAANATSYELQRATVVGAFTTIAQPTGTSFVDSGLSANTTYVYRVRARNSAGSSAFSNLDHATTILFTDDPLVARVTVIKAIHLTQIRTAVNAMRVAAGLAPATWTNPSPAGVAVRAVHINELRNALNAALAPLGKSASYTDPTLTPGMPIKAVHFQELRNLTK